MPIFGPDSMPIRGNDGENLPGHSDIKIGVTPDEIRVVVQIGDGQPIALRPGQAIEVAHIIIGKVLELLRQGV